MAFKTLNKIILAFAICLALLIFVNAVSYGVSYRDTNNAGIFNQTNVTFGQGISLLWNGAGYNFTSGDFISNVFYNSTTTAWGLSLSIADTYSTLNPSPIGVVNQDGINVNYPNLVGYWNLDGNELSPSESLGTGLVGLWHLNEANGNAIDSSGNGNNGLPVNGVTQASTGKFRTGYYFDGNNDYVNISNNGDFDFGTNSFSISTWIKSTNISIHRVIYSNFLEAGAVDKYFQVKLHGGQIRIGIGDGTNQILDNRSSEINDNNWHNLICIFDRDSSVMQVYKDGIKQGDDINISTVTDSISTGLPLEIGGIYGSDDNNFEGSIDEFAVFNGALSQTEINTVYEKGLWALDSSGNGNNGTMINGTGGNQGPSSGAANFDGIDDYINISDNPTLGPFNELTTSAWVYPVLISGQRRDILFANNGYFLGINTNAMATSYIRNGTAWIQAEQNVGDSVPLNQWSMISSTYDGTTLTTYLNSIPVRSVITNGITDNPSTIKIGSNAAGTAEFFNGSIDEVLIYNKKLSNSEIQQIYKAGLSQHANTNITLQYRTGNSYNISDSKLLAKYGFNNVSGENWTYWKDETGRYNATVINTTFPPRWNPNGTIGGALEFNSISQKMLWAPVTIPHVNGTMCAWAYPITADYNRFVLYTVSAYTNRFYLQYTAGNFYAFRGNPITGILLASNVQLNKWYFLCNAWNNNTLFGYLNGKYVGSNTYVNNVTGATSIYIGGTSAVNQTFNGTIDEVSIYNTTLSAQEIENLYQLGTYHIAWNNGGTNQGWSTATEYNDSAITTISSGAKFMQYKVNYATNSSEASPYLISSYAYNNLPPIISSVIIRSTNSSKNDTSQDLTSTISATDSTGEAINFAYNWYKNGYLNATTLITDGLLVYYPMNNDSLDYWGTNDGSCSGTTCPTLMKSNGKIGGAYAFNGSQSITAGGLDIVNKDYSFSLWVNFSGYRPKGSAFNCVINYGMMDFNSNAGGFTVCFDKSNSSFLYINNKSISTGINLKGQWAHLVGTYNSQNGQIIYYVNAITPIAVNSNATFNTTNSTGFQIGKDYSSGRISNATIDEVMVWNRILSFEEVKQLYYGGMNGGNELNSSLLTRLDNWTLGVRVGDSYNWSNEVVSNTLTVGDITNPTATLISPPDNSVTNATPNITIVLNDESSGIANATLYIYNETELYYQQTTSYSAETLTTTIGIVVSLVDGIYTWFYSLFDWAGNNHITGNYTLIVDTVTPLINFTNPTNVNGSSNLGTMTANISITERNIANITWNFNGTLYSMTGISNPANLTNGLVLLMNFENESSYGENDTQFYDFSGNGNNGTCASCPVLNNSGKFGKAVDIINGSRAVKVTGNSSLQVVPLTLSIWFRPSQVINSSMNIGEQDLISYRGSSGAARYGFILKFAGSFDTASSRGTLAFLIGNYSWNYFYGTTNSWNINQWHHAVITHNGTYSEMYIDGILDNSRSLLA
ncbi:MAG: LamG domain-containing protein, partial [archaeon]|nr:LamG domain-containing protein [archaeon]